MGLFRGSLERLNLRENNLTSLPEDIFDGLNDLSYLDLGFNNLISLPEDIFDGLNNLQGLRLEYNNLPACQRIYLTGSIV